MECQRRWEDTKILSARLRGNWPSYWSKPSDSSVASVKTKTHPVNSGNRKLNAGERFHILPFGENSSSSIFRIYLLVCGMWITPIDWHLGILHCHNVGSWESSEVSVQKIIRIKPMWWGPHTSSCKSMQNLLSAISCEQILAICHKGSHRVHSVARWWQWVYSLDYPFWPGCDAFSKHTLKRYLRKKLILSWKSWGGRWDAGRHAKMLRSWDGGSPWLDPPRCSGLPESLLFGLRKASQAMIIIEGFLWLRKRDST